MERLQEFLKSPLGMISAGVLVLLAGGLTLFLMFSPSGGNKTSKGKSEVIKDTAQTTVPANQPIVSPDAQGDYIKSLEKRLDSLTAAQESLRAENQRLKMVIEELQKQPPPPPPPPQVDNNVSSPTSPGAMPPGSGIPPLAPTTPPDNQTPGMQPVQGTTQVQPSTPPPPPPDMMPPRRRIIELRFGLSGTGEDTTSVASLLSGEEQKKTGVPDVYRKIPPLSYTRGVVVMGVDAPSEGEDAPIIIRLTDAFNTAGPEQWHLFVSGCAVLGSVRANLSSERAEVRLESMVCTFEDGKVEQYDIKGWVVDPFDGRFGIKGKVVSKQGEKLARSLLASTLKGIADVLRQAQMTTYINPITGGQFQTITGDPVKAAVYGGVASAAEDLANFYLERARQLFPVIEIPAGKEVEIVLYQGFDYSGRQEE